jgi:hypothetical protein
MDRSPNDRVCGSYRQERSVEERNKSCVGDSLSVLVNVLAMPIYWYLQIWKKDP